MSSNKTLLIVVVLGSHAIIPKLGEHWNIRDSFHKEDLNSYVLRALSDECTLTNTF